MISAPKEWRRWCGPRSELVRATEFAADEIRASTGLETEIAVEIRERSGLTDAQPNTTPLTSLHPNQLRQVTSVAITIKRDLDAWLQTLRATEKGDEPPASPQEQVRIRVTKYGTTLDIDGDDRTWVEGLRQRLSEVLERGGATNSPGFRRLWLFSLAGFLAFPNVLGTYALARWLGLATTDGRWSPTELVAVVVGATLPYVGATFAWWLFPPIELFDDGGAGRARRFRKSTVGIVGTLVLAVLGAFIYDGVK